MQQLKKGWLLLVLAVSVPQMAHADEHLTNDAVMHQGSGSIIPLHDALINQHGLLELTPEQEVLWQKYALAYQKFYDDSALEKESPVYTSSIQKMEQLADIDLIHALDKKLMTEAFRPLYNSLSTGQKQKVDEPVID